MNRILVWATAIFCIFFAGTGSHLAHAQDPRLDNIIVTNTRDDLLLYLTARDAFPNKIEKAIHSGLPATFTFYINLYRVRSLYADEQISQIKLAHTLKFDNLKKEYTITRSWEDDRPLIVNTFDEAKKLMTEVDSLVVVPLEKLEKGLQYQIRAKAELDKMTLPFYLHYVLFFISFWDVATDWYTIDFIY